MKKTSTPWLPSEFQLEDTDRHLYLIIKLRVVSSGAISNLLSTGAQCTMNKAEHCSSNLQDWKWANEYTGFKIVESS